MAVRRNFVHGQGVCLFTARHTNYAIHIHAPQERILDAHPCRAWVHRVRIVVVVPMNDGADRKDSIK
jgi:hypothetical protein